MKLTSTLAGMGLALALIVAPQAQELLTGADQDLILGAVEEIGSATMASQDNGDPLINGSVEGLGYQLYFRNCTGNTDCEDLNFYAGFSAQPSLETINTWNRDKRFSRAYLDEVGDAAIEMDLDLVKGVSPDYLASQVALWPQILAQFAAHIGYR